MGMQSWDWGGGGSIGTAAPAGAGRGSLGCLLPQQWEPLARLCQVTPTPGRVGTWARPPGDLASLAYCSPEPESLLERPHWPLVLLHLFWVVGGSQ